MFEDYFSKYRHYFDDELEKPITAKPAPVREGAAKGTDPGGPLTSKIVGITSNPTLDQVKGFQEKIREGASRVELGFMGTQKGSSQAPTPESMSDLQRKDIRDLAKLNEIETTVHAAPSVSNLSGFTQQGFSEDARSEALNEIQRAVDFAADASTGGAVVVHWDEWQRPLGGSFAQKEDKGAKFEGFSGEFQKPGETDEKGRPVYGPEQIMFVNTETDKIQAVRRDMEFTEPVISTVSVKKDDNLQYLDYEYEHDGTGNVKTETLTYDDIIEREKRMNDPNDPVFGEFAKFSQENFKGLHEKWNQSIEPLSDDDPVEAQKKRDKIFVFHFLRKEAQKAYEQYLQADSMYNQHQSMRLDEKSLSSDRQRRDMAWAGFKEQMNKIGKYEAIEDYGMEKAADTVSEAAVYAWHRSKDNKDLNRNLYIAPESVFPQKFGSHPDEMMSMIENAREKMKDRLIKENRVKDEKEAQKAAEESIKTTLDIGHLNMWRRHMQRKENETPEQFDKRFKKWAVEKSKEMAEKGYVGHAHMSDNFGFGDEHLTVGEGNAPIREFVEEMRRTGKVDDFIVEVGSYNPTTAMADAWKNLGVTMGDNRYFAGTSQGAYSDFSSIRGSYAGRTQKPSYVFGSYAPQLKNEKWQGWQPWTGIPL